LDVSQTPSIIHVHGITFSAGRSPAATASRSADGSTVTWSFPLPSPVSNQHASFIQIVSTNSTGFTVGNITFTSATGATVTVTGIFVPLPVAEPATILMWAGVFGGLILAGTRKKWLRLLASSPGG
jgi:hypothetical protein